MVFVSLAIHFNVFPCFFNMTRFPFNYFENKKQMFLKGRKEPRRLSVISIVYEDNFLISLRV